MGVLKYIPTELFPNEATLLLQRERAFTFAGLPLNQIPEFDVMTRERVFPLAHRTAPLGPGYIDKAADYGGKAKR